MPGPNWSILGTVGVPGRYGGFETLAENLVRYHSRRGLRVNLSVYCSTKEFEEYPEEYLGSELRFVRLSANGPQSIPYDVFSLFDAVRRKTDGILLLGVSGALALPLIRALSKCRIVTNIDGIEWRREKWRGFPRLILRWSERAAVRWSHEVIADNAAIAEYVRETYKKECHVIAYGGDHALAAEPEPVANLNLPQDYVLALCRIEPENNVAMILEAFSQMPEMNLVFVGNWVKSEYGRDLLSRYGGYANMVLVDSIYDPGHLRWLRNGATAYVHGHSAGGTNPSLVEMMHFGVPIFAHGCLFNRHTTENKANYFLTAEELTDAVRAMNKRHVTDNGSKMAEIAKRRYTWERVGREYFSLMQAEGPAD